jgi:hypothetical protein
MSLRALPMHRLYISPAVTMVNTNSAYLVIDTSRAAPEQDIYTVAKVAREKIISEAAHKDHDLRRLVGHTTLYDKLLCQYQAPDFDDFSSSEEFDPSREFNPPEYDFSEQDEPEAENEYEMTATEVTFERPEKKISEGCSVPRNSPAEEAFQVLKEMREQAAVKIASMKEGDGFGGEVSHDETITIEIYEGTTFVDVVELSDDDD